MGIVRVFLALSVLLDHARGLNVDAGKPYFLMNGAIAVNLFFIISGFYMALILDTKYQFDYEGLKRFYINRTLRIFPIFFICAAIAFAVQATPARYLPDPLALAQIPILGRVAIIAANFLAVGSDLLCALPPIPELGSQVLLNPPAWSIAVELSFYLVAPFVARQNIYIVVAILGFAGLLRAVIGYDALGLGFSNLDRVFLAPCLLVFFVAGVFSYKLFGALRLERFSMSGAAIFGLIFILFCAYNVTENRGIFMYIPLPDSDYLWLCYAVFAVGIAFIFSATKRYRYDNFMGKMSYPLYLSHWPIMMAAGYWLGRSNITVFSIVIITCIFSALVIWRVDIPIDRYRHRTT